MRKQYHFWKSTSGDGVDAWDVDRLIEMSADLPASEVPVASIEEIDSVYWFDGDRHRPTVRAVVEHVRLIQDVDTSYPIIRGPDGRVMDGMHRIARAVLEDRATISAVTFSEIPEPDYRGCAPSDLDYDDEVAHIANGPLRAEPPIAAPLRSATNTERCLPEC